MTGRAKQKAHETANNGATQSKAKQKSSPETSQGKSKKDQNKSKKVFVERNSLLTDLSENIHLAAIRNMAFSFYLMWLIYLVLGNYLKNNELSVPGMSLLAAGYQGFYSVQLVWFPMFFSTIVFFGAFKLWASIRAKKRLAILDYFAGACMVAYVTALLTVPLYLMLTWDFGLMWRGGLVGEQIRMTMKVIAFLSSKTPECLKATNSADKKKPSANPCISLKAFVYFLVAPTIVYSDTYPRSKEIRWPYVAKWSAQIYICLQLGATVYENTILASTKDFGSKIPITVANVTYAVLYNTFPAFVVMGAATYGVFHCLQNMTGELLRFGDRQFYLDWWTQGSVAGYFRNAHILPQEWLNYYVYRPIKDRTKSRLYSQLGVFVLSGIVHEIIFIAMFRFFYPVTYFCFVLISGPAAYFNPSQSKTPLGNFIFLLTYPFGLSILQTLLSVEVFARENCPRTLDPTTDFFVPRSWYCNSTIHHTYDTSEWSLL